jgi:predicted flap endonuclease-1-like 5' DNA nuclease
MATAIIDIEGIGKVYAEKLQAIGINTVEELLEKGATRTGRKHLSQESDIDEKKILKWVNMADLFRIKGIGTQFSELLEAAGVDTVKELRNRNPENLHAKLLEVQEEKKLTRVVPGLEKVKDFIGQAKELEPIVTY